MNTTIKYFREWEEALGLEIRYLKKFGSTNYLLTNGRLLPSEDPYAYYFDTKVSVSIPVGSQIRLEWGGIKQQGKILSSEGESVVLRFERSLGDELSECFLFYDPWELLQQLIDRLKDAVKSKTKRLRMKRLLDPSMPSKHPKGKNSTPVKELFTRSKYNPVTFVWGPPGTGKTYTLARVAANHYLKGKKVLILSHSNQAVDVLMNELALFLKKKQKFKEGDVLRHSSQSNAMLQSDIHSSKLLETISPSLLKEKGELLLEKKQVKQDLYHSFSERDTERLINIEQKLLKIFEKIMQMEAKLVQEASIIGTTLAKAASDSIVYEQEFDLVIIDEASMAYVPQVAFAATLAKHIIICGDFKQLPPIAAAKDSIVKQWLKEDIFHHAGVATKVETNELHPHLFLLDEQRRMPPEISAFTNHYVYHDLVKNHPAVLQARSGLVQKEPFKEKVSLLLDNSYAGEYCISERTSYSRLNIWNLLTSFQLIHEAYIDGNRSIGYITPYRAQAELMNRLLEEIYQNEMYEAEIMAATVHKFQGSECNLILFDSVDSYPQSRPGMLLMGKDSERLINVAITRTKEKFIHICDAAYIQKNIYRSKTIRQLVDYQIKQGQAVSRSEISSWMKNQHSHLQWMYAKKLDKVLEDISNATKEIIMTVPDSYRISEQWVECLQRRNRNTKAILVSSKVNRELPIDQFIVQPISFAFIVVDKTYLWVGVPVETNNRIKPPYISARLKSKRVIEHLLEQVMIRE